MAVSPAMFRRSQQSSTEIRDGFTWHLDPGQNVDGQRREDKCREGGSSQGGAKEDGMTAQPTRRGRVSAAGAAGVWRDVTGAKIRKVC